MKPNDDIIPGNPEDLKETFYRCSELLMTLNATSMRKEPERRRLLSELFGRFGADSCVASPFFTNMGRNTYIGEHCFINLCCTFLDDDLIILEDHVNCAPNVKIYTAFHSNDIDMRKYDKHILRGREYPGMKSAPVVVRKNAGIGGGSIILPGVTIGERSVIGAGSLVTRDIPADVLAYGRPCRVIRKLNVPKPGYDKAES